MEEIGGVLVRLSQKAQSKDRDRRVTPAAVDDGEEHLSVLQMR